MDRKKIRVNPRKTIRVNPRPKKSQKNSRFLNFFASYSKLLKVLHSPFSIINHIMKILHIAAECFPAAKVGGLGDVVGALPKYLCKAGVETGVLIPKYQTKWLMARQYKEIFRGVVRMHHEMVPFAIEQVVDVDLGYPLYVANIPSRFARPGVYNDPDGRPYGDEIQRYIAFQQVALRWVQAWEVKPLVLHCHDHHTALIPFLVQFSPEYDSLRHIPTIFTIHNGMYQGWFGWGSGHLLPYYYAGARGFLDWNGVVNPMACAVRCAWRVTTVSPGYLGELRDSSLGLESLFRSEWKKSFGILNGIDADVWNPATDEHLAKRFDGDVTAYKAANKAALLERFNIKPGLPLITFIGRLVNEKGADLIPDLVKQFLYSGRQMGFVVLGSGDDRLSNTFRAMKDYFPGYFDCSIEYNEGLSHLLYAGSDFLFMPSRVEPCGLNQLYSMRYGTLPIVRATGGLRDTVTDIGDPGGRGLRFMQFTVEDAWMAFYRATEMYWNNKPALEAARKHIMGLDFSWESAVNNYIDLYNDVLSKG